MSTNAFIGRTQTPTDSDLTAALGPSKATWDQLLVDLAGQQGVSGHEWRSYSPKTGWALRVTRKKRTIVWLAPKHDSFEVLFILGDKAMAEVRRSAWPSRVRAAVGGAVKYPEGTGIRLLVRSPRDIAALNRLAAIKLAH